MVGFTVSFNYYQIGSADFLHSFFSTVAYHLENKKWGSRYPFIMNRLYQGELSAEEISSAINELEEIQKRLCRFSPDKVIWDFDDLSIQPPWGANISNDITDLSNYFVTSDGEDFITVFQHALHQALEMKQPVKITAL